MSCSTTTIGILWLATAAAFFGGAVVPTQCLYFKFPNFTDKSQSELILHNHARIFLNAVQVTPDVRGAPITNESGRAVYKTRFRLRNGGQIATFNTSFELNISPVTPAGGEGLAFILAADDSPPAASFGQWLGLVNASTNGAPEAKIAAVEFDTRKNFPQDIDNNHVGLNLNSVFSISQYPLSDFGVKLSSGNSVFGAIKFDGKNISVFVSMSNKTEDLMKNRIIFQSLNLSFLPDEVFVGFSASTSNFTQLNCVKAWEFSGTDFGDDQKRSLWIWLTVAGVLAVIICGVFGLVLFFWVRKIRLNNLEEEPYGGIENQLQDFSISPRARKFGFRELKKATNNFDPKNKLGRGGFGMVYKGKLMNREVAVKRISEDSRQGKQEFIAEVATIGSLHHKNLVKLIGWCYEKRDLLLVYEYMPNGSLDKLIFGHGKVNGTDTAPDWETRQSIICGVAEALDYLHNGCEKTVLHRDVKSSNIMLDSKFEAKLGDFGLARTIRRTEETHHSTREIAGTPGYMAPEIFLTSRATAETDVYAFGVLVLEVVCGRRPGNPSELGGYDGSLAHWAWEFHKEGKIAEAVDERIEVEGECVKEEIEYLLVLGLACCHPNPLQRPTMRNVLQVMKGEANPPILPNERPSFVWPPMPPSFREDTDSSLKDTQLAPFTELTGR